MNRQISISTKNNEKLKQEENASKLIDQLLTWYYNGAYDVVALDKEREKARMQTLRLTQVVEGFIRNSGRLSSAVEDLVAAAREHQGY